MAEITVHVPHELVELDFETTVHVHFSDRAVFDRVVMRYDLDVDHHPAGSVKPFMTAVLELGGNRVIMFCSENVDRTPGLAVRMMANPTRA